MRIRLMIAAAATSALLAGAAMAQAPSASGSNMTQNPSALPDGVATGNAATGPGPSGQAGSPDVTAPTASTDATAPAEPTVAPAAGAPTERAPVASADTVTNGPVPDTAANRKKYGKPMSNAGRMTKPSGN